MALPYPQLHSQGMVNMCCPLERTRWWNCGSSPPADASLPTQELDPLENRFKKQLKLCWLKKFPVQEHQAQAVFNQTEDYVMFPDEATTSLCVWDSRNASRKQLLSLGHNGPVRKQLRRYFIDECLWALNNFWQYCWMSYLFKVRWMVHSPTHAAFLSCSDDFRARFWYRRHWDRTRCTEIGVNHVLVHETLCI